MSRSKLRRLLLQANEMGLYEVSLKFSGKDWLNEVLSKSGLK